MCVLDTAQLHCGRIDGVLCETGLQRTGLALSAQSNVHISTLLGGLLL